MPKMRLPKGMKADDVGVDQFAPLGMLRAGNAARDIPKVLPEIFKSKVPAPPQSLKAVEEAIKRLQQLLAQKGSGVVK